MDTRNSTIDTFGGKKQMPVEKILAKAGLLDEKSSLDFAKFHSICVELFPSDDIKQQGWKIKEIFQLFDRNHDGVLSEEEWMIFHDWLKTIMKPVNALLVVDVQNDFIDGSLALRNCGWNQNGLDVVEPINRLIKEGLFDKIIYTLDWHPENHIGFYDNLQLRDLHPESKVTKENAKVFDTVVFADPHVEQTLWPKHCVMNTWGAQLHKDLVIAPGSAQVRKGQESNVEAYSGFHRNSEGISELQNILLDAGVTHVYVCGLAYDVCVKSTCLDGIRLGYPLAVIDDCCRGVNPEDVEATKKLISENGGLVATSDDVRSLVSKEKRSLLMSHRSAQMMTSISRTGSCANGSKSE